MLPDAAIKRCAHCVHRVMDMVSNNTQLGCGIYTRLRGTRCAKKISPTPSHHQHQAELPIEDGLDGFMLFTQNSDGTV